MHRKITGLKWASLGECPWPKTRRPGGAKAAGLRFEARLAKGMPYALRGQWFTFMDANGRGFCSPDLLFVKDGILVVVECKLTDTEVGQTQVQDLYFPVLRHLWPGPLTGVIAVQYLTAATERSRIVASWDAALLHPGPDLPVLHHFSGKALAPPRGVLELPTFKELAL